MYHNPVDTHQTSKENNDQYGYWTNNPSSTTAALLSTHTYTHHHYGKRSQLNQFTTSYKQAKELTSSSQAFDWASWNSFRSYLDVRPFNKGCRRCSSLASWASHSLRTSCVTSGRCPRFSDTRRLRSCWACVAVCRKTSISYTLSININIFILISIIFDDNYTVQHHEQRCCWNGTIDNN